MPRDISIAATTTYEYNSSDELIAVTDPNKHKTEYGYDSAGNKTSEKNADGDETKWKYDSKHDIETDNDTRRRDDDDQTQQLTATPK